MRLTLLAAFAFAAGCASDRALAPIHTAPQPLLIVDGRVRPWTEVTPADALTVRILKGAAATDYHCCSSLSEGGRRVLAPGQAEEAGVTWWRERGGELLAVRDLQCRRRGNSGGGQLMPLLGSVDNWGCGV